LPLKARVPPLRLILALWLMAAGAETRREPPLMSMLEVPPRAPAAAASRVPPLMVVAPVKPVLFPVRTWVLAPSLTKAELLPPVMRPA
jgi:hypothetical protein